MCIDPERTNEFKHPYLQHCMGNFLQFVGPDRYNSRGEDGKEGEEADFVEARKDHSRNVDDGDEEPEDRLVVAESESEVQRETLCGQGQ